MEYRLLGKSELNISRIGFGTMSLDPDDPRTVSVLQEAVAEGINFFDTADLYQQGRNEILLGRALNEFRNKIILSTKVGNQWRPDGSGWDWNPSKKYILTAAEESLRRLRTDYIDLYQLHGGTLEDPIDDILEAFSQLQAAGKIRYYGISSIRPNVIRQYVKRSQIISVMMQYSLLDRRPEEEMIKYLGLNEVGLLARGTLAKGLLVSKPAKSYLNYSADQVKSLLTAIRNTKTGNIIPESVPIQFVLQNPNVVSAIIGSRSKFQLKKIMHGYYSGSISNAEFLNLAKVLPVNFYDDYR